MQYKDRSGQLLGSDDGQDKLLKRLYGNRAGRMLLKVLVQPGVSKAGGFLLSRKISRLAVKPFVKAKGISLGEYQETHFDSYNDFFTRKIKAEARPLDMTAEHLIAPCDSKLTAYAIDEQAMFPVKGSSYTMESLTGSRKLAEKFRGGVLLLFRLTVDDYHHYCYIDDGEKSEDHRIQGVLHTVNPAALAHTPVYKENTRCLSMLKSRNFGPVLMIEVGALMVGRIVNHHGAKAVRRGEEKGYFEFGGSTVILCFKKGRIALDEDILKNSAEGFETRVLLGEKIGRALSPRE